jgi:hypothetical protein
MVGSLSAMELCDLFFLAPRCFGIELRECIQRPGTRWANAEMKHKCM